MTVMVSEMTTMMLRKLMVVKEETDECDDGAAGACVCVCVNKVADVPWSTATRQFFAGNSTSRAGKRNG